MFLEPQKKYAAYIFDCDGTLVDSMESHYLSWVRAFEKNRANFHFDKNLFYAMGGITLLETVKILNHKFNDSLSPEQVVIDKENFYQEYLSLSAAKEDVVLFAKKLFEQKIPIAVASGGTKKTVIDSLRFCKILEFFSVILTQEDVVRGKPAPDIFLLAAEKLGVAPQNCVVFEDSPNGILAAQNAGMDVVEVS